ncbi:IclR family transcriptional regulator [Pelagibacterium montanilacus]|uniref:IclR family transcriptional regulator n=1 Tax=Pelagibacterium montanilacus TaxID=2185280 RepID=UPI0013E00BFD|nr:IclR family transcriptional regulator [Pelagibacterium montanilacus]
MSRQADFGGSVGRALRLLLDVTHSAEPRSFSELQRAHGLPKGTLHKILGTLETMHFLRRDASSGRYTIGLAVLEIAAAAAASAEDLTRLVKPTLSRLVADWRETCHFGVLDGQEELILDRVDPVDQMVRLAPLPTRRNPLHASAGGLAMLAMPGNDAIIETLPDTLPPTTPHTLTSREDLVRRVEKVRSDGYALDLEEAYLGVRCIAVGINAPGLPTMYISFSLPLQRAPLDTLTGLEVPLRAAADEIEHILTRVVPNASAG